MPLGPWELAIILVIIVIIFGAGKLPEIGGALGKGIREFKTSAADTGDDRDDREPRNLFARPPNQAAPSHSMAEPLEKSSKLNFRNTNPRGRTREGLSLLVGRVSNLRVVSP